MNKYPDVYFPGEKEVLIETVNTTVIENPITVGILIKIIELSGNLSKYGIKAEQLLSQFIQIWDKSRTAIIPKITNDL